MPVDQIATHPIGLQIQFTESDHTYIDSDGQHYESGTAFVGRFKPKFDPTGEILRRKAAEAGITPDEISAQWKEKGRKASEYGTRCHELAEGLFTGNAALIHKPSNDLESIAFPKIVQYVAYLCDNLTFLAAEQIVFSPRFALAGSIDLLMADHSNRTLWILDWKSNRDIARSFKYRKKSETDGYMLAPLQYLDDCHLTHYTLQLGTYSRLIVDEGYLPASGLDGYTIRKALLWIPQDEQPIEFIELPDAGREVAEMIIEKFTRLPF